MAKKKGRTQAAHQRLAFAVGACDDIRDVTDAAEGDIDSVSHGRGLERDNDIGVLRVLRVRKLAGGVE